MDPDWSARTQASPSKIDMEQVRMDTRRDSAVGIASANAETTAPSPLSSHNSQQPLGNTDRTTSTQHDFTPDSPTQAAETPNETSKTKKKKKKKSKGSTATGTLNPTDVSYHSENLETPYDTSPDTGGAGQYLPPDSDDLEWLESAVVKGDTKPTGKKSKTKKRPIKRNDAKKIVENKDGDRISATDEENDQESEVKVDDTQEDDSIYSQNNINTEERNDTPTDSLAFIEDDSFMNKGGTSNWADDMAELDPQPWGEITLGGEGDSAADQGSPITPPSSTSSSIASSSTLVSRASLPDDAQETRSTSLPSAQPQDARFYERQDRRPPRQDHRGQSRPPRPARPARPPRSHPKDPLAQRPHYPLNYSERAERPERPTPMRTQLEHHHGYENWAPSAADPRDHHAVSQKYSNQRQPRSHPLPPRPDVPFACAQVPPHHHPSGHPGHGYPGQGHPDQGHPGYGHPGYLVDSDPYITPDHDRFFHPRLTRPHPGYDVIATDTNGSSSRKDSHWRRQLQQHRQPRQPQRKHEQQRQERPEQQQQQEDDKASSPTQHAMTEEAPEIRSANGSIGIPSEHAVITTTLDHVDSEEVVSDPTLGAEAPPRSREIMGLAMIGQQLAPWEDRDQAIEMLNRRWEEALRSVGLNENTTATAIFYTSDT
ncbi:hypothetical protein BG000_004008 [Podila horticola]|nr:hypothetical protein BG000_004008 [Podila horticola]